MRFTLRMGRTIFLGSPWLRQWSWDTWAISRKGLDLRSSAFIDKKFCRQTPSQESDKLGTPPGSVGARAAAALCVDFGPESFASLLPFCFVVGRVMRLR